MSKFILIVVLETHLETVSPTKCGLFRGVLSTAHTSNLKSFISTRFAASFVLVANNTIQTIALRNICGMCSHFGWVLILRYFCSLVRHFNSMRNVKHFDMFSISKFIMWYMNLCSVGILLAIKRFITSIAMDVLMKSMRKSSRQLLESFANIYTPKSLLYTQIM